MTPSRIREVLRMAKSTAPAKVRDLYLEVYGAEAGGTLSIERCRESIQEACLELLGKEPKFKVGDRCVFKGEVYECTDVGALPALASGFDVVRPSFEEQSTLPVVESATTKRKRARRQNFDLI